MRLLRANEWTLNHTDKMYSVKGLQIMLLEGGGGGGAMY